MYLYSIIYACAPHPFYVIWEFHFLQLGFLSGRAFPQHETFRTIRYIFLPKDKMCCVMRWIWWMTLFTYKNRNLIRIKGPSPDFSTWCVYTVYRRLLVPRYHLIGLWCNFNKIILRVHCPRLTLCDPVWPSLGATPAGIIYSGRELYYQWRSTLNTDPLLVANRVNF